MSINRIVNENDVTTVSNWDSPNFDEEAGKEGTEPKGNTRTLGEEEIIRRKKQAMVGRSVVHTDDLSRVGVWDESNFASTESSDTLDPSAEKTTVYTTEEFNALEKKTGAFSKVKATDDVSQIAIWDLPVFETEGSSGLIEVTEQTLKMPTVEEIEAVQENAKKEAYQEGFELGKSEGFEQGKSEGHEAGLLKGRELGREQAYGEAQAEITAQIEQLKSLCNSLSDPLATLDNEVEQQLVAVAIAVAKHVVRRELRTDPGQVVAAVREAVAILPINTRNIRVYLHPEDATLVKESLSVTDEADEEQRWKIVEDPALSRGGCNVETEHSRIDATVETRLAAVIAQTLGGERESDHE